MQMRLVALVAAVVTAPAVAAAPLVLAGTGFAVGGKTARFERTPKAEAIAVATAALGKPVGQGSHGDCGSGHTIGYAKSRGGFELSFVHGRLSGWTADARGPATREGIGVGATLAQVRKAFRDVGTDAGDEANGGLGPSFSSESGPNGWLDGTRPQSKVISLYAGTTCIAS